jgi:hypothetical protein
MNLTPARRVDFRIWLLVIAEARFGPGPAYRWLGPILCLKADQLENCYAPECREPPHFGRHL